MKTKPDISPDNLLLPILAPVGVIVKSHRTGHAFHLRHSHVNRVLIRGEWAETNGHWCLAVSPGTSSRCSESGKSLWDQTVTYQESEWKEKMNQLIIWRPEGLEPSTLGYGVPPGIPDTEREC